MTPVLRAAATGHAVTASKLLDKRAALVVIAPHPDDETLGCGALLHDAAALGVPCTVVSVTDGAKSHPNSPTWNAARLAAVRRAEMAAAVGCLAPEARLATLGYPDCETPLDGEIGVEAVERLETLMPQGALVMTTWSGDGHIDHQRAAILARRLANLRHDLAVLQYPIWGRFDATAMPQGRILKLFASGAAARAKRAALACYLTQMTALIDDDPTGFVMSPANQVHFLEHPEVYIAGQADASPS